MLSSRSVANLEERVQALGIRPYVKIIHGRDSHDHPKPHADALIRMAQALGLQLSDIAFVGDSETDLPCAKAAGVSYFQVLWSKEPHKDAPAQADAVVETLEDLEAALMTDKRQAPPTPGVVHPSAELLEAIENGDICFYAGSGVSVPSGIGDWEHHYGGVFKNLGVYNLMERIHRSHAKS